jgi:hypothetical protein
VIYFNRITPKSPSFVQLHPIPPSLATSKAISTEKKAHAALSEFLDAFVLLFTYVSFCIAVIRVPDDPTSISLSTSTPPKWFQLSAGQSRIHPEWLRLLADSPISDLTTTPLRLGTIMD